MVNNTKSKILVGCLALLLVLSVGYALFSQNITINGTATAKGDFNITPTCIAGPLQGTEAFFSENYSIVERGYKNETCEVNDAKDTVTINVEFEYPGAGRIYTVKMTNTGTIDTIAPIELELNPKIKFCYTEDKDADPETGTCTEVNEVAAVAYALQVGNGTIYAADETAPQELLQEFVSENEEEGLILKPGNSLYYSIFLGIPESFTTNSGVLNAVYKVPLKATFTQKTN